MAWAAGTGTVANATSAAASSSFTTGAITAPLGEVIYLLVAVDNTGTATPVVNSLTVPGGETATWRCVGRVDSSTATAGSGVKPELWVIKTTQAWTAFQPVASLSASVTNKASLGKCFTGGFPNPRADVPLAGATSTVGTPSIANTRPQSGDLVVGYGAFHAGAVTADADTTNGSWSAAVTAQIGTTPASFTAIMQTKIVTATGTQTYNPTSTSHSGVGAVEFVVAATDERVDRVHAETLLQPVPDARVDRVHTEALIATAPDARIDRIHAEVLYLPTSSAPISGKWRPS
jgi:hypothetical protein